LFVLFDFGLPADRHKPAAKIATMPFPAMANGKNPFPGRLPNRMVFSGIHGGVIAASGALQACRSRLSAATPSSSGAIRTFDA
jgi:hypothetical protein